MFNAPKSKDKSLKSPLIKNGSDDDYSDDEASPLGGKSTGVADHPTLANASVQSESSLVLEVPKDAYHAAYIIFLVQGVGMLLPWNFFITANEYFSFKFSNTQVLKEKFEEAFSVGAMVPNLLSVMFNVYLTSRLTTRKRVFPALCLMALLFSLTTAFVKIHTMSWTVGFFALTVVSVVLINTVSGVYQGAMFGSAGMLGPSYIQAIMTGQGVAGIFASVVSILTKAGNTDTQESAFAYFLTAVAVIAICIVTFSILDKLPIMKYYHRHAQRRISNIGFHHGKQDSLGVISINSKSSSRHPPYWIILKQLSPLAASVTFCFFVTLSVFPSIISNIHSVRESNQSVWTNKFFSPMVCFLVFNAGDFTGRLIAGHIQIVKEKGLALPLLVLARVVFIPLFMFCNYQPRKHGTAVFHNDYAPVVINLLFAVSNGYLGSLCMMYGPKLVAPEHAEVAGTIMALFLTFGLCLGAAFSFALADLL